MRVGMRMLRTVIKKNCYQDSINLMLLTNKVNTLAGVASSQIMMGTDANKDIFGEVGLLTEEAKGASPSDIMIVVDCESDEVMDAVLAETDEFLANLAKGSAADGGTQAATSWEEAVSQLPDANLALFSIPGEYAAPELERALDLGLNVFSFTDIKFVMQDETVLEICCILMYIQLTIL